MKDPTCPLCGNRRHDLCFSQNGSTLLACKECDLFFIDPYPEEGDVHAKVSEERCDNTELIDAERHYKAATSGYETCFPYIESLCADARSVLDVGCGTGRLLELLGKRPDLHRVGIELNADRAEFARRVAGCPIHQVPVEDFEYPSRFDAITLINVLSHIPRFDSLFPALRRLLADDGKLILKTGEMEKGVKKDAAFDWCLGDHVHFLGMSTIDRIGDKYGLEIVHHQRRPLSESLFSRSRWNAPGRSSARNAVKRAVAATPFALPVLRRLYEMRHGRRVYSSLIVMSPAR
jgi:SAM-dependent methyltransferase